MIFTVPNGWGTLSEVNHCHGKGSGHPCDSRPMETAKTGEPITFNGWRGAGVAGDLTPEAQAKFGRRYLLGEGFYLAPSKAGASAFGEPKPFTVQLTNPYVISAASGATLRTLDIDAVKRAGHDGIIIASGRWGYGPGQEDLKQAVVFKPKGRVTAGHTGLDASVLQKGLRVKILSVKGPKDYIQQFRKDALAAVGKTGVITSIAIGGHPVVKIGKRAVQLNKDEVEVL